MRWWGIIILLAGIGKANATLALQVEEVKTVGHKTVVTLRLKNDFTQTITAARAQIFLMNEGGIVVGREARWVIGHGGAGPNLAPEGSVTYHFVVPTDRPFAEVRVRCTRVVLADGRVVTPRP